MKIVYSVTLSENESPNIFQKNLSILQKIGFDVLTIINTNQDIIADIIINKVGDMKSSREAILNASAKINADAYFVFDPDIEIPLKQAKFLKNSIKKYQKKYDFISLYYKGDPPIPAFYILASSLTDFYNQKINNFGIDNQFFDDSDFKSSNYSTPTRIISNKTLDVVLFGKSYSRDIPEFTITVDENDTTTGGATIYLKRDLLKIKYPWKKLNGKSLTWYDSYRTWKLMKNGFKFAKVPIFVEHKRQRSIHLSWNSVIRYIEGFNLYMSAKDKSFNKEQIILHSIELFHYINGMIAKIKNIDITKNEQDTISKIEKFMTKNTLIMYGRKKIWK